jgi:hypothetical protein
MVTGEDQQPGLRVRAFGPVIVAPVRRQVPVNGVGFNWALAMPLSKAVAKSQAQSLGIMWLRSPGSRSEWIALLLDQDFPFRSPGFRDFHPPYRLLRAFRYRLFGFKN